MNQKKKKKRDDREVCWKWRYKVKPIRATNKEEVDNLPEKRFQSNDSKDDPKTLEKEWRHRPRRCNKCLTKRRFKEQTNRDGQYNNGNEDYTRRNQ